MTKQYVNLDGETEQFKDSQFLVFANRILAFLLSFIWIIVTDEPKNSVPLYQYSYSSLSNIISSWCQLEALKFISYPTQTMAKSLKPIGIHICLKVT